MKTIATSIWKSQSPSPKRKNIQICRTCKFLSPEFNSRKTLLCAVNPHPPQFHRNPLFGCDRWEASEENGTFEQFILVQNPEYLGLRFRYDQIFLLMLAQPDLISLRVSTEGRPRIEFRLIPPGARANGFFWLIQSKKSSLWKYEGFFFSEEPTHPSGLTGFSGSPFRYHGADKAFEGAIADLDRSLRSASYAIASPGLSRWEIDDYEGKTLDEIKKDAENCARRGVSHLAYLNTRLDGSTLVFSSPEVMKNFMNDNLRGNLIQLANEDPPSILYSGRDDREVSRLPQVKSEVMPPNGDRASEVDLFG